MELEIRQIEQRYRSIRIVDRGRRARLLASLSEHGQRSPVLVVRAGEHEYVLIDGYARVDALQGLGHDVVEATVLDLTVPDALVFVHRLEATRPRSVLEEGWLIAELVDRHGWHHRTIAIRLQRSASWISRRLALVRTLPESVQCAVLAGTVSPQAAMKSLVPLARANKSDCERLVANLRETLSVRQAERLYQGWKRADAEGRERIVTMPWLFLQAFEATQDLAPAGDPASPLLGDLGGLVGLSQRATRRIQDGLLAELDDRRRRRVTRAFHQVRQAFDTLTELLTGEEPCSIATPAQPS